MITHEQLCDIVKDIFKELNKSGPTIDKPKINNTFYGIEVHAGQLRLSLYRIYDKEILDLFGMNVSQAKELGKGIESNEHFVTKGTYFINGIPIGYFLTAKNELIN